MPFIDVSDVLTDPEFAEPPKSLIVLRRTQTIGINGRVAVAVKNIPIDGIVTAGSGNNLQRLEDQQHMIKRITVHTMFRLRGPALGFQPDIVQWHGDNFVVTEIDDHSAYGAGFISATCASTDPLDVPAS